MGPAEGRNFVVTKKTLSRHSIQSSQQRANRTLSRKRLSLSQQTKHEVEVNSIATRNSLSRQEVEE